MRYWLFGVALLMFAAAATGQTINKKKEPDKKEPDPQWPRITEIAGKTFEQWEKEIHADDPSDREIAIKTILNFGPKRAYEALPSILKELEKHKASNVLDLSVRVNGTVALGTIFMASGAPEDKKLQEKHEKYLKEAITIFRANLKDNKENQAILKIRTLQALPVLGPIAREAFPEVIKLIKDPTTWETRKGAVVALMYLVAFDPKAAPPPEALRDLYFAIDPGNENSAIVRHAALQTLVTMGQVGGETSKPTIIGRIENFLPKEKKSIVKIEAHKSIINLKRKLATDPIDSRTKAQHLDLIAVYLDPKKYKDSTIRLNALQALGSLGPAASSVIYKVQDSLKDPDINLVGVAMIALIHMEAFTSIPYLELIKADESTDKVIRTAAGDTIDQLKAIQDYRKKDKEKKKTDKK